MTVLVIILITFPLIIFIMTAPVIVSVDTENEDYSIHWGRLCSIRAVQILEDPGIRLRLGFWQKRWSPIQRLLSKRASGSEDNVQTKPLRKDEQPGGEKLSARSIRRLWSVLQEFKVSKLNIALDTGDYVLNAQLFPLFHFCNNRWGQWRVNFNGDSHLQLKIESSMLRVLYRWWTTT